MFNLGNDSRCNFYLIISLTVLDSCYSFILVSISYCVHFVLYCYIILLWFGFVQSWEFLLGCLTLLFNWIWVAWYFLEYIFKWTKWVGFWNWSMQYKVFIFNVCFIWKISVFSSSTYNFRPCCCLCLYFFDRYDRI